MEAHEGVGIRSEQALRQRLFLEKLVVLHGYACRLTDLFGYTLLSPSYMCWSILTITKPIISYLNKEKNTIIGAEWMELGVKILCMDWVVLD